MFVPLADVPIDAVLSAYGAPARYLKSASRVLVYPTEGLAFLISRTDSTIVEFAWISSEVGIAYAFMDPAFYPDIQPCIEPANLCRIGPPLLRLHPRQLSHQSVRQVLPSRQLRQPLCPPPLPELLATMKFMSASAGVLPAQPPDRQCCTSPATYTAVLALSSSPHHYRPIKSSAVHDTTSTRMLTEPAEYRRSR